MAATRFEPLQVDTAHSRCTEADYKKMRQAGSGSQPGTFPRMCADCGTTSWSIFGFDERKYSKCLHETSGLSLPCASCYAGSGKFGFDYCKAPCLFSWCSDSCLGCVAKYQDHLDACVGDGPVLPCRP